MPLISYALQLLLGESGAIYVIVNLTQLVINRINVIITVMITLASK